MALSDPELELLREVVLDDPTSDTLLQVAEEFVRRESWPDAVEVLVVGTRAQPELQRAWELLAIAAAEDAQPTRALAAVSKLPESVRDRYEIRRARAMALILSGQVDEARPLVEACLAERPGDERLLRVESQAREVERAPRCAHDPFITVERAEAYAGLGRVDLAVRAYRRILHRNPGLAVVRERIQELIEEPGGVPDDLSEELLAQEIPLEFAAPPNFAMPSPNRGPAQERWDDSDTHDLVEPVPGLDVPVYGTSGGAGDSSAPSVAPARPEPDTTLVPADELPTFHDDEENEATVLFSPAEIAAALAADPELMGPPGLEDVDDEQTDPALGSPVEIAAGEAAPVASPPEAREPVEDDHSGVTGGEGGRRRRSLIRR